ncbi:MAG: hypothetical protein ABL919_02505 [Methylococcales bacterium]|nr:hypothetical protein [Methylococcaceae bacterium]
MHKFKLAIALILAFTGMQAHAEHLYTADATVTAEENTAISCKATNISDKPQKVFVELINDDSKVLSTTDTSTTPKVKEAIILQPGTSHIQLANASSGALTARCHFDIKKEKVRAGLGIYKNRGNGSLILYIDAR